MERDDRGDGMLTFLGVGVLCGATSLWCLFHGEWRLGLGLACFSAFFLFLTWQAFKEWRRR